MLRKLILLGVFAGLSASVPVLHQSNPDAFEHFLRWATEDDETADDRMLVALARPRLAAPEPVSGRQVRISADRRGHFIADLRMNGRIVSDALVDTGATLVAINESTARRIGLNLTRSDFIHEVETANGRTRAAGATIESLEIGRIRVTGVQAVVLEDSALSGTLIGMSFLRRLERFGVENGSLLLEQ